MPILDKLILENEIQIIRPVSEHMARMLLKYLGLYHIFEKDGIYIGDENHQAMKFDSATDSPKVKQNRCNVNIVPNLNPISTEWEMFTFSNIIASNSTERDELGTYPIFADKKAGIYLKEMRVPCSIELNFEMKVISVELAEIIHRSIFNKFMKDGVVTEFHDISFSYPVPDATLWVLYKLFKLKDLDSDFINFQEYLRFGSNNSFDVLVNRDKLINSNQQLVINRSNNRVLGKLDFSGDRPEIDSVNKLVDTYTISFRYVYQFGIPNILRLMFPIMVNNETVPEFLIGKPNEMHNSDMQANHNSIAINDHFYNGNFKHRLVEKYQLIRYPIYDDWILPYNNCPDLKKRFSPLFVGLLSTTIDEITKETSLTVDLRNEIFPMLDIDTRNILEAALINNPKNIIGGRNGIFNITMFCGDTLVSYNRFTMDENLLITISQNVNPAKIYRLVISIVTELTRMSREDVYFMLNNHEYFDLILSNDIGYLESYGYVKIVDTIDPPGRQITLPPARTQNELRGDSYAFGQTIRVGRYIITCNRQ